MKPQVVICICTYERPQGLRTLLDAVDRLRLSTLTRDDISLSIIDNSNGATAKAVFSDYAAHGRFCARFRHEPRKGLSNVRNAALEEALQTGAPFIAFIDDDEAPTAGWIEALCARARETGAGAVVGPVHAIFAQPPPAWIAASGFYAKSLPSQGGLVKDGYTSNCLLSRAAIETNNLRFDARFNEMGGEDTLFFHALLRSGCSIAWAADAIVTEYIPRQRMSAGWLLSRWYRTGAVEAALCAYDPDSLKGRCVNTLKGLARVGAGSIFILAASIARPFRPPGTVLARCYTLCRGAGLLMSVAGSAYAEYSAPDYRRSDA